MKTAIAKILYFPVVIIITMLALVWCSQKLFGPAAIATIDAIAMWSLPVIAKLKPKIIQFSVWANVTALVLLLMLVLLAAAP